MFRLKFGEDFARAVGGTVVDADEFNVEGNSEDSADHIAQCGTLVIYGHDDGEFHGIGQQYSRGRDSHASKGARPFDCAATLLFPLQPPLVQ
jgi:hypothetical protein